MHIGVTGGIGSGKSIVCKLFVCLDIPVYDADTRAKWLTNHDPEIREAVIKLLGKESYTESGEYNRPFVSSQVFKNPDLLKKLNGIIHPAVGKDTDAWLESHSNSPYVIKEAAIMNKAGENNNLDYVIVVTAPVELRLSRIRNRDKNRSEAEIRSIIERQISDEERDEIADFKIDNGENVALIPQVLKLHKLFLKKSGK
ncbi:dephospho-CoA kinase [Dyadobacter frigoris]|uniref:Dephospho-CoA kinase n=1 Tax=Dyadobacter frigoris TaxID=2576211 RepID=A0A4U6D5W9_9BACT|nr:dephospho-CoA kinase [Dyadobacter frigoris]TKT91621.1 dephospho-CoA kinase [Dyadobacter frigoris]GLU51816.1 dephospho-CoA kinase [Dyadobacter frigoris]